MASPVTVPAARRDRTGLRNRTPTAALLAPCLIAFAISFALPLVWLLRMFFAEGGSSAAIRYVWSSQTYKQVLTDHYYVHLAWQTFKLGVIVVVLTLVVTYPIARFLSRTTSRFRGLLMALAIAPLLVSAIVRTYGWIVLLAPNGVVNGSLRSMHLISEPLPLMNKLTGAAIGLVEIHMPFALMAILAGFGRVSPDLELVAGTLGASRRQVFFKVTLPLALPGILTAALLVFVLCTSSFVIPALLGGGKVLVISPEIYNQATQTLNWPLAAVLSVLLMLASAVVIAIYRRVLRLVTD